MLSIRLRRTLINNLSQTSIVRIKFEGAIHEFSRLPGIQEPLLDLIFQFRKLNLRAFFLDIRKMHIVTFFFTGPNIIYSQNIKWPYGVSCSTPKIMLFTLSPETVLNGQLLIQKYQTQKRHFENMLDIQIGKPWRIWNKTKDLTFYIYPWISMGTPKNLIRRIGFRIESLEHLQNEIEIMIFEII